MINRNQTLQLVGEIQQLLTEEDLSRQESNWRHTAIKEKFAALKIGIGDQSVDVTVISSEQNSSPSSHAVAREKSPSEKLAAWLTLAEAARLAEVHRGTIKRMADLGQIRGNGEKGHGRRVEKRSVLEWMGQRIEKQRQRAFADYNRRLDDTPDWR
jgi:excisionase family DNA binding protein